MVCKEVDSATDVFGPPRLTTKLKEGAPTVLFSPVVFFLLPDGPGQAKFLTENEQTLAIERLQIKDRTAKDKVQWTQFFLGLRDYRNVVHTLIHFMCNYSFAGLSNFLPTIIKGIGYSSIDAQGLTAPVYFTSFLLCVVAAFVSDRYKKRGFVVAGFATMGCIGYLLLATIQDAEKAGARYCGVWLAVCGIFPALAINVSTNPHPLSAHQLESKYPSSPLTITICRSPGFSTTTVATRNAVPAWPSWPLLANAAHS